MNIFKGLVLLSATAISLIALSSCARRPGFDRPMNQQRLHGFHRGQGYGHGPGRYSHPPKEHRYYRHAKRR